MRAVRRTSVRSRFPDVGASQSNFARHENGSRPHLDLAVLLGLHPSADLPTRTPVRVIDRRDVAFRVDAPHGPHGHPLRVAMSFHVCSARRSTCTSWRSSVWIVLFLAGDESPTIFWLGRAIGR